MKAYWFYSKQNCPRSQCSLRDRCLRTVFASTNAKVRRTEAEHAVGEQLVEGQDVTAATLVMNQASEQVRILESALAIAMQKDEAAQTALTEAQRQVTIEAEVAAVANTKAA